MKIEVEHDENDIACTIVLLKALAQRGGGHSIKVPLAVTLAGDEGWRLAAIQFLDRAKKRRQFGQQFQLFDRDAQDALRAKRESHYAELNERFDFDERQSPDGVVRERISHPH